MARPPPSKEVQEFQFKLHCRLRIFPNENSFKSDKPLKLLASSSKYGLTFVGCPSGVQCINVDTILTLQETRPKNRGNISDYPRRELILPSPPSHLDISCDGEMLAVALLAQNCPMFHIYSVSSFGSKEIVKKHEIMLSNTPGVSAMDIQWNPGVLNIIGAVLSDGSVIACEFKDNSFSLNTLPASTQATCLCWSPKGKQLVIGDAKGTLSQYKPELKLVKSFPAPQLTANPQTLISVQWLSSFQFAAVYKDAVDPSKRPALVVVNVPKGGEVTYINYEEICFGSSTNRPQHFFIHQQSWNLLIIGCGNSMELGVLKQMGETPVWEQWCQGEATRAELPLTDDHQDVYTVGLSFDTSGQKKIPVGESRTIDPMPIVHVLSHEGVLCMFYSINLLQNAANLCSPPQPLPDQSGINLFSVPQVSATVVASPITSTPVKATVESPQPFQITSTPATTPAPMTNLFSSAFSTTSAPSTQGFFSSNTSFSFSGFGQPLAQPGVQQPQVPKLGQTLAPQQSGANQMTAFQMTTSANSGILPGPQQNKLFTSPLLGQTQPQPFAASTPMWPRLTLQPQQQTATSGTLQTTAALSLGTPQPQKTSVITFQTSTPIQTQQSVQPTTQQLPLVQSQLQQKPKEPQTLQEALMQPKAASSPLQQQKIQPPPPPPAQQDAVETKPVQQKPPSLQQPLATQFLPQQQQVVAPQLIQSPGNVLQQTTVPQLIQGSASFSFSASHLKGGFSVGSNFPHPPSHRKQDAIKATTIMPITLTGKGIAKVTKNEKSEGLQIGAISVNESIKSAEAMKEKYKTAIQSEVKKFAAELNALKEIISSININIGDEEEKKMLKTQTESLEMFGTDLRETTCTQEAEVSTLRANLMETFSWFENINGRHSRLTDSRYSPANESVELDPITRQHIKSIEKNLLYLESHVKIISADLETKWMQKKRDLSKKSTFEVPALEAIFQSIMTIYKLIAQQKTAISELENSLPMKAQKKMNFQELKVGKEKKHITGDTELSKLAEKLLSTRLGDREDLNLSYSDKGSKYKSLMRSQHNLQSKQEDSLRQWHKNFKAIRTKVIKKRMVTDEMINATVIEPEEQFKQVETNLVSSLNKVVNKEIINITQQITEEPNAFSQPAGSCISIKPSIPPNAQVISPSSKTHLPTINFNTPNSLAINGNFTAYTPIKTSESTDIVAPSPVDGSMFESNRISQSSADKTFVQNPSPFQNPDPTVSSNIFSGMGQSNFNTRQSPNKQESSLQYDPGNPSTSPLPVKSDNVIKVPQFNPSASKELTKPVELAKNDDGHLRGANTIAAINSSTVEGDQTGKPIFGVAPTFVPGVPSIFSKPPSVGNTSLSFTSSSQGATSFFGQDKPFSLMESNSKLSSPPKQESAIGVGITPSNKEIPEQANNSFAFGSIASALQSSVPPSKSPSNPLLKVPQVSTSVLSQTPPGGHSTSSPATAVAQPTASEALLPSFGQLGVSGLEQKGPSGSLFGSVPTPGMFSSVSSPNSKPFSFNNKGSLFGSSGSLFGSAASPKPLVESLNTTDGSNALKSEAKETTSEPVNSSTLPPTEGPTTTPSSTNGSQVSSENVPESESTSDVTSSVTTVNNAVTETTSQSQPVPASSAPEISFGSISISASSTPASQASTTQFFPNQSSFVSSTTGSGLLPTPSVFATAASSGQKVFGNAAPAPATTGSAPTFGSGLTTGTTSSTNPLFPTPAAPSMFAAAAAGAQSTSAPSLFGGGTPTTTSTSLFSGVAQPQPPSTTAPTSLFGTPTTSATGQPSVFGGVATTTPSQPVFGTPTSSTINFGTPTSSTSFGGTTTASTLFGGTPSLSFATPTTSSAFSPPVTTTTSLFGTPSSGFGTPATTASIFGTPTTSSTFGAQSPSVFGATTSTAFGTPSTSGTGFFAQPSQTPTTSSSNAFGSPPVFGQPATTSTPFGSLFGQKPVFGQPGASVFSQSPNAGNFGSSGGSLFGSTGFGAQNQQQSNLFQSPGGSSIFGGGSNAPTGSFTGGSQSVSQTGFGSPSFQAKPSGFGGAGSPVFGSQASFGSPPTFGGAATFGSPNKVFGTPNQTAFSNMAPQSPQPSTFETLATQNTMTFGNLAQNQQTTGFGTTFGNSPQTTQSSFGGSSFSTWR